MKCNYKIFREQQLMIRIFSGRLTIHGVIECLKLSMEDEKFKVNYNILNDIRNAVFDFDLKLLNQLIDYIRSNEKLYGRRKTAFLTDNPQQVVYTTMLDILKDETKIDLKIFSTLKSALSWLNLPMKCNKMIERFLDTNDVK